jgi:hypothetical protein
VDVVLADDRKWLRRRTRLKAEPGGLLDWARLGNATTAPALDDATYVPTRFY